MDKANEKSYFLYPRSRYYGEFKPEYLVFDANLQNFSQQIGYISSLETSGKISPEEAFFQVKSLWTDLKISSEQLGIDISNFSSEG
ncbi:DUF7219 family protein [Brunnivagina elsteri]|uniref:Isopropylmalate/homocitrate/citramalate synthase n=1 Tax=Brunnivagina elsteri CCALA 953 TaxID=987040 RepID=A0A2A2TH27_9CYAN|nr:hypothetical protein [Calothrix elsteri]PAX53050.1 hypothetical protein CK510_16070 [Calothrix elsteri CCALA 953]